MIDIVEHETEEGRSPFAEWFDGLDARAALKVRTAIARIETGNFGDVKPVGAGLPVCRSAGLSERRIDFGPGYRVYFGRDGASLEPDRPKPSRQGDTVLGVNPPLINNTEQIHEYSPGRRSARRILDLLW